MIGTPEQGRQWRKFSLPRTTISSRLYRARLGGVGHDLTVDLAKLNASDTKFDLLLSDVKMPGMDGIELALAGRDHSETAIMLMTGYAHQRERGLDALVHDVIRKPFSVDQIACAVREALVQRRETS